MALLTDVDIRKALDRDIVIEPFCTDCLSPVGYDFRIGDFVFSLEHGLLHPESGVYFLPAKSTIQILTKESLWVSKRIAGTFHSRVSLVSQGLSHISTTLDPGWIGPLLITLRNNRDKPIPLKADTTFVTLVFFRVATPTTTVQRRFTFIQEILLSQLGEQTEDYIRKVTSVITDSDAKALFERRVREAHSHLMERVVASIRRGNARALARVLGFGLLFAAVALLLTLELYWDQVSWLFRSLPYDSNIANLQITGPIALLALAVAWWARK